jgi:hypothetical protein
MTSRFCGPIVIFPVPIVKCGCAIKQADGGWKAASAQVSKFSMNRDRVMNINNLTSIIFSPYGGPANSLPGLRCVKYPSGGFFHALKHFEAGGLPNLESNGLSKKSMELIEFVRMIFSSDKAGILDRQQRL